jgi:phosphoribosylanthranilate isomerase
MTKSTINRPQIKICGITTIADALACAELGADAIGLVFYPKSPRRVIIEQAAAITQSLPSGISKVGVLVDEPYERIVEIVDQCGLDIVQLHGKESPELVGQLIERGVNVVKALFTERDPQCSEALRYPATAFLLECGKGRMPGGIGEAWDWKAAQDFSPNYPFILAGGLNPNNVVDAISACDPDAVDVSSGVEKTPGQKDNTKIKQFIDAIKQNEFEHECRRIF